MEKGCRLCPRECGVDRKKDMGFCRCSDQIKVAKAMLHHWEEPCISGSSGSGAIFFSGCVLKCVFCQNCEISDKNFGQEISAEQLGRIMLDLKAKGVHNINLVNLTHFADKIIEALDLVKADLGIPVVYNSGGYERLETLRALEGYVDVYLPDFKYFSAESGKRYSGAENYFPIADKAIAEMIRQTGGLVFEDGLLKRGVIIRHLVLPMGYKESIKILEHIEKSYDKEKLLISIMSQYTPMHRASEFPEINRKITDFEYKKVCQRAQELGLSGYFQERGSATEEYTPNFDLSGILV